MIDFLKKHCAGKFQYWTEWVSTELFSLIFISEYCISSDSMANEWEEALFWPIAVSHLCYDPIDRIEGGDLMAGSGRRTLG